MNKDTRIPAKRTGSTRDRIMDAALAVFGEYGYDGSTTKEIAARAGVNEVTIFRNFNSKDELFQTMIASRLPTSQIMERVSFDLDRPIDDVLRENVTNVLRTLAANRDMFMVMVADIPRRPYAKDIIQFILRNVVYGPIGSYLRSLMDMGRMRRMDPEIAARALFGMVQSYFLFNYLLGGQEVDEGKDELFVDGVVTIFLDGMREVR